MQTKREIYVLGGERKVNKISKIFFGIDVCTVSYLRRYCSDVVKCLRFKVLDEDWFLVFGVWYLAHLMVVLLVKDKMSVSVYNYSCRVA